MTASVSAWRGRHQDVADLRVLVRAAVLRVDGFRREDHGVLQRALHLLERDLASEVFLELRGARVAERAGDVAVVELHADELPVLGEGRDGEELLAHFLGAGLEVQPLRFLGEEALVDEHVDDLVGQVHHLRHLGRELLPELLLVHRLDVLQRALVVVEGDGLAVHARRELHIVLRAAESSTSHPHVDEDEAEDERRDDGDEHPLEVMETVAHYFEHGNDLSRANGVSLDRNPIRAPQKAAQFTYSRAARQLL